MASVAPDGVADLLALVVISFMVVTCIPRATPPRRWPPLIWLTRRFGALTLHRCCWLLNAGGVCSIRCWRNCSCAQMVVSLTISAGV
jgi:hypothetical protein